MTFYLQIRTSKFPVLEGEEAELVNPGTHGKAFAEYLQEQLKSIGYRSPFICCEDWGWWVEIKLPEKAIGLGCYRDHDRNTECDFVCTHMSKSLHVWSWRRFRTIDLSQQLTKLEADLTALFEQDSQIEFIGRSTDFPL